MDFTGIKELYIPEGKVKMITFPDGSSYLFGPEPYKDQYLTFESLEDNNTISWKVNNSSLSKTISVSTDNGKTWTDKTSDTTGVTLATLNTSDKLLVKGFNATYSNSSHHNYFMSTKEFNVFGNIMSMIYGNNFIGQITLDSTGYNFGYLFYNCTKLISTENLILPATTLAKYCYVEMFYNCTSLTTAPELPDLYNLSKTFTKQGQYQSMFENCTKLTYVPDFSVYKLSHYCCQNMFKNCTSLVDPPNIKCFSLNGQGAMQAMFKGCTKLKSFTFDFVSTISNYSNLSNCFKEMFYGCSSLNYIKYSFVFEPTSATNNNWVYGVSTSGTFINEKTDATTWAVSNDCIPSGWTIRNSDVLDYTTQYLTIESLEDNNAIGIVASDSRLYTSNSANISYLKYSTDGENWTNIYTSGTNQVLATLNTGDKIYFKGNALRYSVGYIEYTGFTSTKTFNLYGNIMSLLSDTNFVDGITLNNTNINNQAYCFSRMFTGTKVVDASNLVLPATSLSNSCYYCMFNGCTSLTTAPELPATTLANNCYNGMFQNCTSLTTAPELPATTPANYCYSNMFYGCTNLNYIKMMLTNIDNNAMVNWVYNVQTVSGTFIKNPDMDWLPTGVHGVPENWTLQDAA